MSENELRQVYQQVKENGVNGGRRESMYTENEMMVNGITVTVSITNNGRASKDDVAIPFRVGSRVEDLVYVDVDVREDGVVKHVSEVRGVSDGEVVSEDEFVDRVVSLVEEQRKRN